MYKTFASAEFRKGGQWLGEDKWEVQFNQFVEKYDGDAAILRRDSLARLFDGFCLIYDDLSQKRLEVLNKYFTYTVFSYLFPNQGSTPDWKIWNTLWKKVVEADTDLNLVPWLYSSEDEEDEELEAAKRNLEAAKRNGSYWWLYSSEDEDKDMLREKFLNVYEWLYPNDARNLFTDDPDKEREIKKLNFRQNLIDRNYVVQPEKDGEEKDGDNLFVVFDDPKKERFTWTDSDKLGEGAFGEVFKAKDSEDRSGEVAVKKLTLTKKTKNTIIRETEILSRMHHKNIAELVQAFRRSKQSPTVYIAMELCNGGDLFDAIKKYYEDPTFPGDEIEKITKQVTHEVLEALAYCHGLKVAHLDLKPANIVLSKPWSKDENDNYSKFPSIKLIDWGHASEFKDFRSCPCKIKGTMSFTAPEVFTHEYTEKADLWSVGVIIYVMLQGAFPFDLGPDGPYIPNKAYRPNKEMVCNLPIWEEKEDIYSYSDPLKIFLNHLLTPDPDNRPSAVKSLKDPWFSPGIAPWFGLTS